MYIFACLQPHFPQPPYWRVLIARVSRSRASAALRGIPLYDNPSPHQYAGKVDFSLRNYPHNPLYYEEERA